MLKWEFENETDDVYLIMDEGELEGELMIVEGFEEDIVILPNIIEAFFIACIWDRDVIAWR